MSQYPEVCPIPAECGPRRACQLERWGLGMEEDLGALHAPPCFLSLLKSLHDVEVTRRYLDPPREG